MLPSIHFLKRVFKDDLRCFADLMLATLKTKNLYAKTCGTTSIFLPIGAAKTCAMIGNA